MADSSGEVSGIASSGEAKKTKKAIGGKKKAKTQRNHPPTAEMVNSAIKNLKERGGSSLAAIKKYLVTNYKVDADKMAPFIKKYLKNAVSSGQLIQTKGKGASGSFKLASSYKAKKKSSEGDMKATEKTSTDADKKKQKEKQKKEKVAKMSKAEKEGKAEKSEKKSEKKKASASVAKVAKESGTVKVKQKPTKPSKISGAKSVKVAKVAKVPKVKKASTAAAGKKMAAKKNAAKK